MRDQILPGPALTTCQPTQDSPLPDLRRALEEEEEVGGGVRVEPPRGGPVAAGGAKRDRRAQLADLG